MKTSKRNIIIMILNIVIMISNYSLNILQNDTEVSYTQKTECIA